MRLAALAVALCAVLAAADRPSPARAAADGRIAREEALEIVGTPLAEPLGRA